MARSIRQRLDQLDDNAYSEFIVGLSDSFGWWWNLGLGFVLLLATPAAFAFGSTTDGVACAASAA